MQSPDKKNSSNLKKIQKKIPEEFDQYLLIKYLKKIQPQWTKVFAIKMISKKEVLVNHKKTRWNYRLKEGDLIEFYGQEKVSEEKIKNLKKLKKLNVLFEDQNIIIVEKESKIAVQFDEKNSYLNMNNRLLNHLNFTPKKESWTPVFIHRLDYNTTGLLIGAKNYQTYRELNKAQREGKIKKYYQALVHEEVEFQSKTLKNWIIKKDKKVYISKPYQPESKYAECLVRKIRYFKKERSTLLEIELITGRTHQIRIQLAHLKHPIRGDQKYGIEKEKKKYPYPALCAYKLYFDQKINDERIKVLKGKSIETKNIWFLPSNQA